MKAQHTPGPWRYQTSVPDSNYMLIFCSSREGEGDNLRGYCGEANARLIAAAPEILQALQELLEDADNYADDGVYPSPLTRSKARAAIAKATGWGVV